MVFIPILDLLDPCLRATGVFSDDWHYFWNSSNGLLIMDIFLARMHVYKHRFCRLRNALEGTNLLLGGRRQRVFPAR